MFLQGLYTVKAGPEQNDRSITGFIQGPAYSHMGLDRVKTNSYHTRQGLNTVQTAFKQGSDQVKTWYRPFTLDQTQFRQGQDSLEWVQTWSKQGPYREHMQPRKGPGSPDQLQAQSREGPEFVWTQS